MLDKALGMLELLWAVDKCHKYEARTETIGSSGAFQNYALHPTVKLKPETEPRYVDQSMADDLSSNRPGILYPHRSV